ncbi:unnamed protein product [Psylliodes chrysocephalus]|uniref:Retrotransposon gag domain-containing protein n=1 Tax=Psylliodes chrysocephalus TaxID=3402493 RepID=A0A9P0GDJ0_9CUCU|nr:unnamed protein product [Psylliodes chrysocephala]
MPGDEENFTKVDWIYKLKIEELITYLSDRKAPTEGTVEELKTRLLNITKTIEARDPENSTNKTATNTNINNKKCKHIEIIRKCGLNYDGSRDPIDILEQIKELQTANEIQDSQLLQVLSETLKGKAILWYRNNNRYWDIWDDFIKDFTNFFTTSYNVEKSYPESYKKNSVKIQDYVIEIQTLVRRHKNFDFQEVLNRIYTNMRPEYKLYIKSRDVSSVGEFIKQAPQII